MLTLYTDGGARGNPGPAGIGVVISDDSGTVVAEISEYLGSATNNVAEYQALIRGLQQAAALGGAGGEVAVFADSELMVKQMRGEYQVKNPELQSLHGEARKLLRNFRRSSFTHVPRAQNAPADRLVNAAIDAALGIAAKPARQAPEKGRASGGAGSAKPRATRESVAGRELHFATTVAVTAAFWQALGGSAEVDGGVWRLRRGGPAQFGPEFVLTANPKGSGTIAFQPGAAAEAAAWRERFARLPGVLPMAHGRSGEVAARVDNTWDQPALATLAGLMRDVAAGD